MPKALLFLNGSQPKLSKFSAKYLSEFDLILATDGAYNYLKNSKVIPNIVIGDMDSLPNFKKLTNKKTQFIKVNSQENTDFDKALTLLTKEKYSEVYVWGAGGNDYDHFLGNLSSAKNFQKKINIKFFDEKYCYYFLTPKIVNNINSEIGKIISLFPFPSANKVLSDGLLYPLVNLNLKIGKKIGIRNQTTKKKIVISFASGSVLIFITLTQW